MRRPPPTRPALWLLALATGCTGSYESAVRRDLSAQRQSRVTAGSASGQDDGHEAAVAPANGTLREYIALALRNNPEIRATFERWQASVHRISRASRLPEPVVGFGYFLRSVETRVGPQQARLSLQQAFPWPTKLSAGADAASAQARAAQRRFDAQALIVAERVARAYWDLWQLRSVRDTHREHLDVIRGLSESARARLATGATTLAELQQIDLTLARVDDGINAMNEAETAAEAQLRAAVGVGELRGTPTTEQPLPPVLPSASPTELERAVMEHPLIESHGLMAVALDSSAEAEAADRMPSFTAFADWIITGETTMPGVADSGKDAVIIGTGVRVPLWQGSYDDSVGAARAEAEAVRADQRALADRARAELESALSAVRDAARRARLYEGTLVPQAESTYESVLGAYTVGRGTVAQSLLAQRDLLELRVELDRARADHARAWARLEQITGRELEARADVPAVPPPAPPIETKGDPHDD